MMQRPRLSRPFYLSLLAIASLLALSYFPLARIRAASAGATILPSPSAGKPLVNLKNPQTLKVTYTGSADAVAALQGGTANPTALAAADFDADGAMDLVAGYSTGSSSKTGGVLALLRGNPDAFAPTDLSLYAKAAKGSVPATFLSKATAFTLPESPDLLVTGDFNRDGYKDVLVGARGGNLYLLAGDGHGNLLAPQAVPLPGQVTALAATGDAHVAVTMDGPNGPQLAILAPGAAGLTAGATYNLPARGDAVAWGSLGGGADVAVGAGANVVMIYNALGTNPQTETVSVPFQVKGLALGDFIWDRDGRTEISVLADDGSIHILQHGTLNTTPLTAADLPARRAAIRGHHKPPATPPDPTALGAWTVASQLPYTGSAPSGPLSASAFNSPRLASASTPDLMVIDAGRSQLNILDTSGKTASPSAAISFTSTPAAAYAMPQKINADRDLVVLSASQIVLVTAPPISGVNVTTTADEDDVAACTTPSVTSGTGGDGVLSLREAVCEINNRGAATNTISIPPGTYLLTSLETGELRVGATVAGQNLFITGSGTPANTIIKQTDGVDRIIEEDFNLQGNNPLTIQNVTLEGGNCTTGIDCGFNGGAILAGSFTGDDLTLTNVVLNNNSTPTNSDGGGAIEFDTPPNLTITSSIFSSNSASAAGGAIEFKESGNGGGNLSVTNSSFTSNTAVIDGGGISMVLATGFSATISGSTFNSNSVTESAGLGGGIFAEQSGTVTVSNSRFVLDSAPGGGTGATMAGSTAGTLINNWWGCNGGPIPSNTGICDTVLATGGGTATFDPWLVLRISPNPTEILPTTGTSTLTADLTHNSNNIGGFSVPNGTPVAFGGATLGTLSNAATTLTSGQGTATYTAGATPGHGTATATVDNASALAFIEILDTVTVDTSPTGLSITVDSIAYTAPQTFNWIVGSNHTLNTTSPQNVSGGSEQVWSSWSQGGTQSQTVSAPVATTTYTANFTQEYQLTTAASPSADGTVTPASGNYYASGASIPVTATANSGFQFTNWTTTGTGTFDSTTAASTNFHMPAAPTSVTGNFSLIIVAAPTTTSVSSNNNPSFTSAPGNSVTFTATVTSNSTVNEGTVTFSDPANDFTCSGGNTVPVSNGQATCTTAFTTEGARTITGTYNGTINFQTSNGNITQTVNNHTVVTGNQFCNPGAITIPSTAGAATPYPSNIFVTSLSGNIGAVTVSLNGINSSNIQQTDLLLVGPTGAQIVPFAHVGDSSTISGVNITLDDAAATLLPGGSPLSTGAFKPTSITGSTSLVFPAPAPVITAANYAATDGAATLTSQFGGTAPNGTWALYAIDNEGTAAASIGNGWCVNITPATAALTVTKSVTSIGPYNTVGQVISYQFVAKNTGNVTLHAVGITDTQTAPAGALTSGPTCQSLSSPTGACSGSTTTLISGQSATFTATYTITQADLDNGSVNDSATASGTPASGPAITSLPSTATVTTTSAPALTVAKSVTSIGPYNTVGQVISYQFVAKNTGNVTLHAVGITDTQTAPAGSLTSGPTCQSLSTPPGTCSGSTTTLVTGQSATFTATYTITQADLNNGSVNDSATASGTPPSGPPVTSTPSTATVTLTPTVQITITTSPANLLVSADGGTPVAAPLVENWTAGSSHTIATSSPQAGGPGVQYVWSNWNDSGAISHSITVPGTATTYTATFNTQYQLTTVASPSADGSVTPASGSYFASGATIPVTATANAGFTFSNWTSTGGTFDSTTSASTNFHMPAAPATVTGNFAAATTQITITTSPAHLLVSVDGGTAAAAPLVETWNVGSSHTIATSSPQSGGTGVQYVWSNWSDSGAISHSITVPSTATTYTANFTTQYQLTTQASPSADGSVTPASGSYFASGATIPVTATANAGFTFSNWTSTGGTFDSTTSASTNFHMPAAPATVTGNFAAATTQITITTSPAHLLVSVDGGTATAAPLVETWNVGSSHTIATSSPQSGGTGVQYVWSNWSDSGAISHSITVPSTATTYTATFNTQYQLTTAANPTNGGTVSPPSGNFYTSGTIVPLTATANAGFTFHNWTGAVANSTSASTTITMNAPQSVTANFTALAQLSVTPTSINFGTVEQFDLLAKNVTVKNIGASTVSISKVSVTPGAGADSDDFTPISFCKSSLAPGKSCTITVVFFADNLGTLSATLYVTDNAAGSPQAVTLTGIVKKGH